MSTTVRDQKAEREILEKKYKAALNSSMATKQAGKTEIQELEMKGAALELKKMKIANIFYDLKHAEKVDICKGWGLWRRKSAWSTSGTI